MNANNEFDRLIKDKLAHGQPSVPSDAKVDIERVLIEKGLIKKDERGRKGFYIAFSVIAFIAVVTAALLKFYASDSVNSKSSIESSEISNQISGEVPSIVKQTDNKQQAEVENSSSEKINTMGSREEQPEVSVDENQLRTLPSSKANSKIKNQREQRVTEDRPGQVVNTSDKSNLVNSRNQLQAPQSGVNSDFYKVNKNSQLDAGPENSGDNSSIEKTTVLASVAPASIEQTESDLNVSSEVNSNLSPESETIILPTDSSTKQKASEDSIAIKNDLPVESPKVDSTVSVFKFSAEGFGGIQQTYLQSDGSSGGSQSSTTANSNSEWIGGLKLSLIYKKHFTFGAGINYSVHHSDILYNYTTYNYDSTGVIPVSNPAHIITDFNVTEIPLLLGYYVELNKFAFHFESGVSFSMISNAQSTLMFETSLPAVDNFSGIKTVKSYSSYVGQFSALYSIGKNFQVFLQPSINVGLSEIFVGMPEKKINMISLKTGLRLNF